MSSSGFCAAYLRVTITRNGVTEVLHQSQVRRRLVNGVWIDELAETAPAKRVKSKVVKPKALPAPKKGQKR